MTGANIVFPECIICLTPLQSNLITPTNCGHVFHEECFRNWKNKGSDDVCPLCKRDSSHTIKLIYDIKYCQNDNSNQEPQTLSKLLQTNKYLKFKNDNLEEEVKELITFNNKCQEKVEEFKKRVEDNSKNMLKYKDEYLSIKVLLNEEKEKNIKYTEQIDILKKEVKKLSDFKNKVEMKNKIDEETEKIILNKNEDKMQEDFEKQFYSLLNDDDEKKGLHEYFYVLQQKIVKLTKENEELYKYKKNIISKEKNNYTNNNIVYTQLLQLSERKNKRNYMDYNTNKKSNNIDNKKNQNNNETNIINNNDNNISIQAFNRKENFENKKHINSMKLKSNNNNNLSTEFKKIFNNPLRKKELMFKKK